MASKVEFGMELGANDEDNLILGANEGILLGMKLGSKDGLKLGAKEGIPLGTELGKKDDSIQGFIDGIPVAGNLEQRMVSRSARNSLKSILKRFFSRP